MVAGHLTYCRVLGGRLSACSAERMSDELRDFMSATVDSQQLEYGPGRIYAGFPSSLGFGVGGQSYSNFLASTVAGSSYQAWYVT